MRILIITIATILVAILLLWIWKYIHSKTIGYDKTDCMIQYVNNHYPNGAVYSLPWGEPHIDGRDIWLHEYHIKDIHGCYIDDTLLSSIYNIPYCLITVWLETIQ